MRTVVEIHVLQNFAPSNLNRDDTGAPKDAIFGGTRRARVSSQCLKRAVRTHFTEAVADGSLAADDLGVRTKRLLSALTDEVVARGRSAADADGRVRSALGAMGLGVKDDDKSQYLLFLGRRELLEIARVIDERWDTLAPSDATPEDGKKVVKTKKKTAQDADPELKKALDTVFDGGKAVDVALFGRMLADMPEKNQHAACQVAHAISTHVVEREFDFFTAVDDRKPEDSAGADMIGTVEFNSACFYRYAAIDWDKLIGNLQDDSELAARGLEAFLKGFVVAEPTGKQNTFAAHNPPEFVAISVRRNTGPRSLANAFELAVRPDRSQSITRTSAEALVTKAKLLDVVFGGEGTTRVLDMTGSAIEGFGEAVPTLAELLQRTISDVEQ